MIGIKKTPDTADNLDLARLGHAGQSAGQLLDDAFLEPAQRVEVDLRLAEGDAVRAHCFYFVHHPGSVQQRLGRNTADVQAHAAQRRVTFDEDRFQPEVSRPERRGITAWPRAEHEHLAFHVGAARVGSRRGRRHCSGCCGRARRARCLWRRRCRRDAGRERENERAFRHLVAELDLEFGDCTRRRRRHIHGRLVRLERDQRVFALDRVAAFDVHLDDRDVLEIADVGHADVDRLVNARCAVVGGRRARRRCMAAFLDLLSRRDARRRDIRLDGKQQRSL